MKKFSREYYKRIKLAQQNDNIGVLENIYDNEIPHPAFDPKKIAFRPYRLFHPDRYNDKNLPLNKIVVFEDRELNLANFDKTLNGVPTSGSNPLTDKDYMITSWLSDKSNLYKVPTVFNSWALSATREANINFIKNNNTNKPYIADVLLGNKKLHREIFFNLMRENGLLDRCIVNYFDIFKSNFLKQSKDLLNQQIEISNNISIAKTSTTSAQKHWTSQLISKEIYENSWLSIISESTAHNGFFCPSEKIGKPLIAGRPFIVLAEKNFLKNLRLIGFATFHPFIDEKYDEIDDIKIRTQAAFNSFQKIKNLDFSDFEKYIKPILSHNVEMMKDKSKLTSRARKFLEDLRNRVSSS